MADLPHRRILPAPNQVQAHFSTLLCFALFYSCANQPPLIQRGFYVAVASVPVGLALYKFSTSDAEKKPWITRLIEQYSTPGKVWEERNHLHTMAMERAASDRHLFYSQNPPKTIELSCPEYVVLLRACALS